LAFTFFFRDPNALDLIARHVVPTITGRQFINIWDAGCAHGPEPFSLAITLRENMSHFLFRNVRIYATDVEPLGQFRSVIKSGIFPEVEVSRIPDPIRTRYFSKGNSQGFYKIDDEIRERVEYHHHDLLSFVPIRTGFSLIICKNVLLHFSEEQRISILQMFYSALCDGGFLVVERTQKLPSGLDAFFEEISSAGCLFRKKDYTGINEATLAPNLKGVSFIHSNITGQNEGAS
jgi:chemotaxis protein methyltransferase CheR